MPATSVHDHYASAALRHYNDAVYLREDNRIANADYHFGFTVECALKSLLLRYAGASMSPTKPGRAPAKLPWMAGPDGKPTPLSHLPGLWSM